jgi:pyrroloquinoline quinone biosynthesis protein B
MKILFNFFVLVIMASAGSSSKTMKNESEPETPVWPLPTISLIILGTIQDAGSPQAACRKACCKDLFVHPDPLRKVVSLGIIDPENKKNYLLEATPDIAVQMHNLFLHARHYDKEIPDGIILTHAHIGHYSGLMYLGRESINTDKTNVFCMPGMKRFLETNGPWSQLVDQKNISLQLLTANQYQVLGNNLKIKPLVVPHRDEFSETVGYIIEGPDKKALFIPDIDKWEKWETNIIKAIGQVDYAFIDGTFYDGNEINNRPISEIPHPFITESMRLFKNLPKSEKNKIYFIHFNHTNPVLDPNSPASKLVLENGFKIARMNQVLAL